MSLCECGCGEELTGKQKRFKGDDHRSRWWTDARRIGAGKMGSPAEAPGVAVPLDGPQKSRGMHKGDPYRNNRISALRVFLLTGPKTTLEIRDALASCAPSTEVSALRLSGYDIRCRYLRRTSTGSKVYLYTMVGKTSTEAVA